MIDLGEPIDISIPLDFYGGQVNAFGVENASARAVEAGEMIGDTRRGGSCNFEQITLVPHCNGTHTECVGHITHERISVNTCLKDVLVPAVLVSVKPEPANASGETYSVAFGEKDILITAKSLSARLQATNADRGSEPLALAVRTLPNNDEKLTRRYGEEMPPYFSNEAMEFIVRLGIKHLLVDLPSIDRLDDQGKLSNHRIFWSVQPGQFEIDPGTRVNATITELIYVPNETPDGEYLLNLQIAPFVAEASPSRPLLFRFDPSEKLRTEK